MSESKKELTNELTNETREHLIKIINGLDEVDQILSLLFSSNVDMLLCKLIKDKFKTMDADTKTMNFLKELDFPPTFCVGAVRLMTQESYIEEILINTGYTLIVCKSAIDNLTSKNIMVDCLIKNNLDPDLVKKVHERMEFLESKTDK